MRDQLSNPHMSLSFREVLLGLVMGIMALWFLAGIIIYSDGPIHSCDSTIAYEYSYHPYGYCGKQGQLVLCTAVINRVKCKVDVVFVTIKQSICFYNNNVTLEFNLNIE